MKKKNIAVIGIVGIPGNYGGFETLVDNLVEINNYNFTVYCSSKNYSTKYKTYKNANLVYLPFKANGISSVIYDIASILHSIFSGHRKLLVLGVSGAIIFPLIKLLPLNIKIITNIDGIEWRRDKWNIIAKKFLKFSEKLAIKNSDQLISDNKGITDYISDVYNKESNTIAYGGDQSITSHKEQLEINLPMNFALAICRIERENNVHMILEAFSKIDKNIVFIGNWNNSEYGRGLKRLFSKYKNISILDPIYDQKILFIYRKNCDAYIHGHSAGGTNPSLVEMMFFNVQIVAFDCIYNRHTLENNGFFFSSEDKLIKAVQLSGAKKSNLPFLEIANKKYTWKQIKKLYSVLFRID